MAGHLVLNKFLVGSFFDHLVLNKILANSFSNENIYAGYLDTKAFLVGTFLNANAHADHLVFL